MKKILLSLVALFGLSQAAIAADLTFATEATYPPFVSMTANHKMVGFGPDVVQAVCQKMHKTCKLVNAPWDSLIPSLKMGKYDGLFGGMAITKARQTVVDFSLPYYQNAITFVTNENSTFVISKAGLKGKIIGVQGGTTFQQYLQTMYGSSVTLKTYASNMTALLDLKSGRVNAVFIDKPVATAWLEKSDNHDYKSVGNIIDTSLFGPGNAIAINKGNATLQHEIDKALVVLKANGTLKKLQQKWFK